MPVDWRKWRFLCAVWIFLGKTEEPRAKQWIQKAHWGAVLTGLLNLVPRLMNVHFYSWFTVLIPPDFPAFLLTWEGHM